MNINERVKQIENDVIWKEKHPKGMRDLKNYVTEDIDIWWEGPFTQEEIINNQIDSKKYDNTADDIGLYQIYSSHPLYGSDVLVYIGMTVSQGGFKSRLKNRWVIENNIDNENVKIYLGRVFSNFETIANEDEIDKIKKAEALLINTLTPAFNSSYIQSAKEFYDDNFQINNHNNYRNLYPQLSSEYYWSEKDTNFIITKKLSQKLNIKLEEKDDDYYGFDVNENIFFGIDYKCWNKINIPLVIGAIKDSKKKKILEKEFEIVYSDDELYYISASDNLKNTNIYTEIETKIEKINQIING